MSEDNGTSVSGGVRIAIRVGITGTRERPTLAQRRTLAAYLGDFREQGSDWQHNGDCVGTDLEAGILWRAMGGKIHLHPPANHRLRAFQMADVESEPKPYDVRNRDIVDKCDALLAVPLAPSEQQRGGTWATVRYARRQKRPLIIIWPNGSATVENWYAQGIEARSGETAQQARSGTDESPVPAGDAPTPDSPVSPIDERPDTSSSTREGRA